MKSFLGVALLLLAGVIFPVAGSETAMVFHLTFQCIILLLYLAVELWGRTEKVPVRDRIPSLVFLFVLFIYQFYILRAIVYVLHNDSSLMTSLGVDDPVYFGNYALVLVDLFLGIFVLTNGWVEGMKSRHAFERPFLWAFRKLGNNYQPVGLVGIILGGFAIPIFLLPFYFHIFADDKTFSNYIWSLPFLTFGVLLMLWDSCTSVSALARPYARIFVLIIGAVMSIMAREFTTFRLGTYTGLGLILGYEVSRRSRLWILLVFLLVGFPFIRFLGGMRNVENKEFLSVAAQGLEDVMTTGVVEFLMSPYDSTSGDFTCFDVTASVLAHEQRFRPWGLSYLYPIAHFVPRTFWPGKPEGGILTDEESYLTGVSFGTDTYRMPYTAGLVGDLYLEGGIVFVPLFAFFYALLFIGAEKSLTDRSGVLPMPIVKMAFAILFWVSFFLVRSKPYQLIVWFGFILLGVWLTIKLNGAAQKIFKK